MKERAKQPVGQLSIFAFCRFAEPIAYTSVFPYLPEMIESFGVDTDNTGKWVGICSGSFSFCQFLTAVVWGRASDHIGRKRAVLAGLVITMVTSLLFGFSTTLATAIASRALAGLGGGNGGIYRTAVAELVPQKDLQPRAFSVMPLSWTVGSMLGPALGGALADPAHKYPDVFGSSAFLLRFPYSPPNLLACVVFTFAIAVGFLFLQETLHTEQNDRDVGLRLGRALVTPCHGRADKGRKFLTGSASEPSEEVEYREERRRLIEPSEETNGHNTSSVTSNPKKFTWKDVFTSQSQINLLQYCLLAGHSVSYDQLLPVLMHHPHRSISTINGSHTTWGLKRLFLFTTGFGMTSNTIGFLMMLNGILGMILQFFLFPPVVKRFGVLPSLKISSIAFVLLYAVLPFSALVPSAAGREACLFAIMIAKTTLTIFAWPSSTILMTNSASSPAILGTLNGVATSLGSLGRTIGPLICGFMFTVGLRHGTIALPWWTLAAIAAVAAVPVFWLKSLPAFGEREAVGRGSHTSRYLSTGRDDDNGNEREGDRITSPDDRSVGSPPPSSSIAH